MSNLYTAKKTQPETYTTEFDILKASQKFLRNGNEDEPNSWEAQLAKKYEDTLFKEFAVCNLKHYKSGNIALRWRTEDEVLSGAGESSCGNTRCPYHDVSAASRSQNTSGGRQPSKPPKLTTMELPFSYLEQGETKVREVMVKVVLCERCVKKSMWSREKKARREPVSASRGSTSETGAVLDPHATGSRTRDRGVRSHRDRNEGPGGRRSRSRSMSPLRRTYNRMHIDPDNSFKPYGPLP